MDKRYGGVSKTRQFPAGKLLNYFTLPKTNLGFENRWLEVGRRSFHLGFRPIFQGPKPCWMLSCGLRLKPGWRYPQSCQEATKWAKNTGGPNGWRKRYGEIPCKDSTEVEVFFFPTLCCDVFVCFVFVFAFGSFPIPPQKKRAAVGRGSLEETFDVERNGALLKVRCIFTIDHSWDPFLWQSVVGFWDWWWGLGDHERMENPI